MLQSGSSLGAQEGVGGWTGTLSAGDFTTRQIDFASHSVPKKVVFGRYVRAERRLSYLSRTSACLVNCGMKNQEEGESFRKTHSKKHYD